MLAQKWEPFYEVKQKSIFENMELKPWKIRKLVTTNL
jgi:hypothetical protein